MFSPVPVLRQQFFDLNGKPLAGGKLWSYIAGTSTPSSTFTDASGATPNTNPIILDAGGEANVWIASGGGSYKFVLMDLNDVVQWTVDNVNVSAADVPSGWAKHAIIDGQSASDLVGQTVDFALYTSAFFDCEILRGTTVIANGQIVVQNKNGVARVMVGVFIYDVDNDADPGITFTVSQVALVAQLRAAASTGPGNGTIKLSRRNVLV